MKNPLHLCPTCKKVHGNPTIDLFNQFMAHFGADLPEGLEMDFYRAYVAGQHDCFSVILRIADYPDKVADVLVKQVAAAIRDATLAGIDPHKEELIAKVRKAISAGFGIPQNECASDYLSKFHGN